MAKRKLGVSVIILCIAAVTLISGTYAWFLVGGFAELFNIGFDVIEATGNLVLRGDAAGSDWKTKLDPEDFTDMSFIVEGGRYRPVSSSNGTNFISVTLDPNDNHFICNGIAYGKQNPPDNLADVCYNDFTFYIKSTEDEIPAGAFMKIKLSGTRTGEDGQPVEGDELGAAVAARVSVTIGNDTKVYAADDKGQYYAVTNDFSESGSTIIDQIVTDGHGNSIIDLEEDAVNNVAGLQNVDAGNLMTNDGKIPLGRIPGVNDDGGNGQGITVRIWLEGNDPDCVDFPDGGIAGKNLTTNITFGTE